MEILSTTDVSREGNDCYLQQSYTLIKQFGVYAVIFISRASGWASHETVEVLISTTNADEARKLYKEKCMEYKR